MRLNRNFCMKKADGSKVRGEWFIKKAERVMTMKKKLYAFAMIAALLGSMMLTGCGAEKQEEKKK